MACAELLAYFLLTSVSPSATAQFLAGSSWSLGAIKVTCCAGAAWRVLGARPCRGTALRARLSSPAAVALAVAGMLDNGALH